MPAIIRSALLLTAVSLPGLAFAQDAAPPVAPLAETCPNLTAQEIADIENYKGEFIENAYYARAYCVSVAEAERRMEIQLRGAVGPRTEPGPAPLPSAPDADLGTLQAALRTKEADTFAGLWIQHQPTYGVAVAFTRDAAATLARYTTDPLYIPITRPGPSLVELHDTQRKLVEQLSAMNVSWFGIGSREQDGTVNVSLGQSADPIRAAAQRGEIDLPDYVVFDEPDPFPIAEPPRPAGDTRITAFPRFSHRTDGMPRTLVGVPDVSARLYVENGCLWLHPDGEEPRIAVWERSMAIDLTDPARVAIISLFDGARIYADSDVVLMGLQPGEQNPPAQLTDTQGCPGPYRVVRGIVPRAQWDAQQREGELQRRESELGNRTAALADYEADRARLPELTAWRDMQVMENGDVIAAIWIDRDNATAHLLHTATADLDAIIPAALRPHVTTQVAPVGAHALEAARADIAAQLQAAGIDAELTVEPIDGYVRLRPADLAALSAASGAHALTWPDLVRIETEWASPLMSEAARQRRDPEAIWYRLEAHPDFAAIRALVEKTPIPRPEPPLPGSNEDRWVERLPSRAGSLQQTHFLIAYGHTLDEIVTLRRAGFDPVEALEAMNGRATLEKRAIGSSDVIIAEPVAIDMADRREDGFASTVNWKVVEVLKGGMKPGDIVRQRMASGERADDAGVVAYRQGMEEPSLLPNLPLSLRPGSQWLLHLNDALYRHMAFVHGDAPGLAADDGFTVASPFAPPALIDDTGMARPVATYPAPMPIEEYRRAIAPIQQALTGKEDK